MVLAGRQYSWLLLALCLFIFLLGNPDTLEMKYIDEGDWEPYFDQDGVKKILDFVAGAGGNCFLFVDFFTFYKVVCFPK